jgi:predicted ATP-grasp superfamily ATP-dependent carboligase
MPVIFPTNDKMVTILAKNWDVLAPFYLLSWSAHTALVEKLQFKDEVENQCKATGVFHPASLVIDRAEDIDKININYPFIVKPVTPMSSFKVELVKQESELKSLFKKYPESAPFIIQQWIEGDDERLVFCSMYMQKGKAIVKFLGRKLQSYPAGLGQGTIMEPYDDPILSELSETFFNETNYTGPVSIEFKVDNNNCYWLIEPNIGRTEFSVECAEANNVKLAQVEYLATIGNWTNTCIKQNNTRVWFDTEKDITAYIRMMYKYRSIKVKGKLPAFPYFDLKDIQPFFRGILKSIKSRIK